MEQTAFSDAGGTTTLAITTSIPFCRWEITAPVWVQVTPIMSGFGSVTLTVSVSPHVYPRQGYLTVGDDVILIRQRADLTVVAHCSSGAPGTYQPLACIVVVLPWGQPTADLRVFGLPENLPLRYCCPDGVWDLDFHIPVGFPPGPVPIPFRAVDSEGRVATTVAYFNVL